MDLLEALKLNTVIFKSLSYILTVSFLSISSISDIGRTLRYVKEFVSSILHLRIDNSYFRVVIPPPKSIFCHYFKSCALKKSDTR